MVLLVFRLHEVEVWLLMSNKGKKEFIEKMFFYISLSNA